jgi:hypothetical protein
LKRLTSQIIHKAPEEVLKLECANVFWQYTGWSRNLCAPDDYSTKTRKNILISFNHLAW